MIYMAEPPAAAVPAAEPLAVIAQPDWERQPPRDAFVRFYPKAAQTADLEGRATLACVVDAGGALGSCSVASEAPQSMEFGAAALNLAPLFKMKPLTRNGQPVGGGRVNIPILFRLPTTLNIGPIKVADEPFNGAEVVLDCRFHDRRLDNCFKLDGPADATVVAAGLRVAQSLDLPPLKVEHGRVRLALVLGERLTPTTPSATITSPDWIKVPSRDDVQLNYPRAADLKGQQGTVVTRCVVKRDGWLTDCVTIEENPPYQGFAAMALTLMKHFQMRPTLKDGRSVEGETVVVPLQFRFHQVYYGAVLF